MTAPKTAKDPLDEEVTDEEFAEAMSRIAETLEKALVVVGRISSKLKGRPDTPT